MRTIVVIGSGDVELGAKLCNAYGCAGLVAPYVGSTGYAYGYLHMTTLDRRKLIITAGVEYIDVDEAIKELI
ncbi:MAG TPA: hypothetical protein VK181_19500 [Rhizobium sp.]|nr:hypothetical protein [Rhizobium sp.]